MWELKKEREAISIVVDNPHRSTRQDVCSLIAVREGGYQAQDDYFWKILSDGNFVWSEIFLAKYKL